MIESIQETPEDVARDILCLGMVFAAESGDKRILWRAYGDAKRFVDKPLDALNETQRRHYKCLILS